MKIRTFFLIMLLFGACAKESENKSEPSGRATSSEAIGDEKIGFHESEASPQSDVANFQKIIERRLRERYTASMTEDNSPILTGASLHNPRRSLLPGHQSTLCVRML
ncbi:MAG: hypothetical protein ACREOO_29680 [bacterium]